MAPLRASLARSPPRLGRSQAGGFHPQTPRAAPPGTPSRTGPLLPRLPSRRGFRARVRRWRFSGFWEVSKSWAAQSAAGGSGGVPPVVGRRWATRPRRWAARVQPQAVPAVHGLGEVVHGRPGHRAERLRHPVPARRRRSALHRVRSNAPKVAPGLRGRDNFGRSKDNFVLSKDKKHLIYVFQ